MPQMGDRPRCERRLGSTFAKLLGAEKLGMALMEASVERQTRPQKNRGVSWIETRSHPSGVIGDKRPQAACTKGPNGSVSQNRVVSDTDARERRTKDHP